MTSRVAVIAHTKKNLGGGLPELRRLLSAHGCTDPDWYEVTKSRDASALAHKAVDNGANLVFVWGGDGTVQRCVDAIATTSVSLAILPAGTANLLATNLSIPTTLPEAVDIGFNGARRVLDVGVINDERFAVMAGVGLDAVMMRRADGNLKRRLGQLAYVWSGIHATRMRPRRVTIKVDGERWFDGGAVCVLLGQMGALGGGLIAFPDARPDDGSLEVAVLTGRGLLKMASVLGHVMMGRPDSSRFTQMTRGREVRIKLDQATPYQLDGGVRKARRKLRASVEPLALSVCVPACEGP